MDRPACLPYNLFAAIRGDRQVPAVFEALWSRGSLDGLRLPTIAIVGTRAASSAGKAHARRFASELGAAGCCIVSGLALGIDGAAHQGALDMGVPTIGVLGSGHNRFFPRRNRALAEQMIAAGGAVLSPFPPDHAAFPWQFLERNEIVAALSDAVVVIEAPARSGALNTAGWAAGRIPVFAVPGDIDRPHVAGCHALIRDGAILARSAADVIEDLRLTSRVSETSIVPPGLIVSDPIQQRIIALLRDGESSLDAIMRHCDAAPPRVLAALSFLEISGAIEAQPGQRYALR